MKKSILIVLSIALVAGTMSSCYKSSKGKMEGDWTIDGLSTRYETSSGGGTVNTTTISGSTITNKEENGGATITETGEVKEATWTITKDGTWDKKMHTVYTETGGASHTFVTTSSGTWDFLIGTGDDYKKKERVAFYSLEESTTYTFNNGSGFSTSNTSGQTFKDGENSMVFVISESKNKSLIMKSESGGTSSGGTVTSYSEEVTMTQP